MRVLVTGGAGYIGSHMVRQLVDSGHDVAVVDNVSRGHREAVPAHVPFHQLDIRDTPGLERVMRGHDVDTVMHFAALAYVGESIHKPDEYYRTNAGGSICLLEAMDGAGVKRLVFSSTCATYGEPERLPIEESFPQLPINPYGRSKLFVEQMLRDKVAADPSFGFVALRYFNVAGCSLDGSCGEDHDPETHLIPILLQVALGQRESVTVFGTDYPTPDGTCIRDYIHVEDLCAAHLAAGAKVEPGQAHFYNLGIGRGYSIREVLDSVRRVTGKSIATKYGDRRPGDPAILYADAQKANRELAWTPQTRELDAIISSAWAWFRAHPCGYARELV